MPTYMQYRYNIEYRTEGCFFLRNVLRVSHFSGFLKQPFQQNSFNAPLHSFPVSCKTANILLYPFPFLNNDYENTKEIW